MAHIQSEEGVPGIRGPQSTLNPAEREMIATYVSSENHCHTTTLVL